MTTKVKKSPAPLRRRQRRMLFLGLMLPATALAVVFALYALRSTTVYFYAPHELPAVETVSGKTIRIGGLVLENSLVQDVGTQVRFIITDRAETVNVSYRGILPGLFAEGQSVVVQGKLIADGEFQASRVLAKHDENYMPSEVKESLEAAEEQAEQQGAY